jgi:F-type H+-transporting ATPase subunit delta
MVSVIASRYASALVDVVTAAGSSLQGSDAIGQLRAVEAAVHDSPQLRGILQNPAISRSRKRAVIGRIAGAIGGISPKVRNFLFVAADRGRIGQLTEIREAFETLLDQRLGFMRADVTSAQGLDDSQRQRLEAQLSRLSGKSIRPFYSVDPALVGGVIARVGSTVYDGSVRGQLETLRRKLTR